jgi:hypothetical protein
MLVHFDKVWLRECLSGGLRFGAKAASDSDGCSGGKIEGGAAFEVFVDYIDCLVGLMLRVNEMLEGGEAGGL